MTTEPDEEARHKAKIGETARAVQDAEVAEKTIEKGLLIVHTGQGQGQIDGGLRSCLLRADRGAAFQWRRGAVRQGCLGRPASEMRSSGFKESGHVAYARRKALRGENARPWARDVAAARAAAWAKAIELMGKSFRQIADPR